MTAQREAQLRGLAARLGHRFKDLGLLDRALTHASQANESQALRRRDNEPLEFLGDAVLERAVTDLLHRRDPEGSEGTNSRRRAQLVSAPSLARRALGLGLPELLRLERGEERTGGRAKAALWADAYEAVVVIGLTLIATSVGISVKALMDLHILHTNSGITILGAAVIDDIIGIILLAFLLGVDSPLILSIKIIIFYIILFFFETVF